MHPRLIRTVILFGCLAGVWLAPSGAAAEEGKHLFILSGQSNMTRPVVESFRECVQQVWGADKVIVVRYAKPSQPIKQWYKAWTPPKGLTDEKPEDNGKLYEEMMAVVGRTVKPDKLATVTFIWMQGEADAREWGGVYAKSFLGVVDQIKTDLAVEKVNFVVGRINDYWIDPKRFPDGELVRKVQQELGEKHANGSWIDTDDLNRGVNPWGGFSFDDGHFPPPGYRVIGQRFAKEACLLLEPAIKLDPEVFKEDFIDSAEQIETHAGVGKAVRGAEPADKGAALTALTDGEFAKAEHRDAGWAYFAPSEEPIQLVLDLGSVQKVEGVAVNTLLSTAAKAEFPKRFVYSTSVDGQAFTVHNGRYHSISPYVSRAKSLKPGPEGYGPDSLLLLTEFREHRSGQPIDARYIKVEIMTDENWVLIDELVVNPVKAVGSKARDHEAPDTINQ